MELTENLHDCRTLQTDRTKARTQSPANSAGGVDSITHRPDADPP